MAVGGIATLVLGGLLLVDSPIPEMRVRLVTALAVSIPLGIITVFLMTIALRARKNKVTTGIEGLVGEIGVAETALTPSGKVFVHGEIWDAVAPAGVAPGEKVVVERVDGMRLRVDPVKVPKETAAT
jgi:membrane-bound serine protease (ClpP class)